jgi:hypothetical protein
VHAVRIHPDIKFILEVLQLLFAHRVVLIPDATDIVKSEYAGVVQPYAFGGNRLLLIDQNFALLDFDYLLEVQACQVYRQEVGDAAVLIFYSEVLDPFHF